VGEIALDGAAESHDALMALSDDMVSAKVEELDRLIADLQKRRRELLATKETGLMTSTAPKENIVEAVEIKAPPKLEVPAKPAARTTAPGRTKDPLEGALDSLPWKSFKKKEGEWAFLRDREGRLIDELQSSREFVDRLRKEGEVVVGKYRYQVSEDKFLNRYFSGGKSA
jgi:hypothetical protein